MQLLLASSSPQRRFLLETLGFQVITQHPDVDETPLHNESPVDLALRLAKAKRARAQPSPDIPAIAADTIVVCKQQIIGKPQNDAHAKKILSTLSGAMHSVYTGFSVSYLGKEISQIVETRIRFLPLSEEQIMRYLQTGEHLGKAGSYAVQGKACVFFDTIEGSYTNILGLPIKEVKDALQTLGAL